MASTQVFTLLGVGDDVDLARAELLADLLTRVLPAFKYRKIVVRQEEWEGAMRNRHTQSQTTHNNNCPSHLSHL